MYEILYYGGFCSALTTFLLAGFLFIHFRIPKVISGLSGHAAKKAARSEQARHKTRKLVQAVAALPETRLSMNEESTTKLTAVKEETEFRLLSEITLIHTDESIT